MKKQLMLEAMLEAANWQQQATDNELTNMLVNDAKAAVIERIYNKYFTATIVFKNEHGRANQINLTELFCPVIIENHEVSLLQHIIDLETHFKPEPIILKITNPFKKEISLPLSRRERREADRKSKKKK